MSGDLHTFLLSLGDSSPGRRDARCIETHISKVFLVGDRAYKLKKPVRFPFLDFSTLERRRLAVEREVALNRRYAPTLYRGVTVIGRDENGFNLEGRGEIIDYAVSMERFEEHGVWSSQASAGELTEAAVDTLARKLAEFHRSAEPRPRWGGWDSIRGEILGNVEEIPYEHRHRAFSEIASQLRAELDLRRPLLDKRRLTHVKAIHGDLHLGNITTIAGEPVPFDGIEFNEQLGSGDVWSDAAFLSMDLTAFGRPDLAARFVNTYLEESDDFEGAALLPLYTAHRAIVRAKVHLLQGSDAEDPEIIDRYIDTASDALRSRPTVIIAVGGLSGSGKTTLARGLAQRLNAIVVRTDVVRKHILGLHPLDIAPESGYTTEVSTAVYRGLIERARLAALRGGPIILDGVHREASQREGSESLARELGAPFTGLWCAVPKEAAVARVMARRGDASNAHRGVIERQYAAPPKNIGWRKLDTSGRLEDVLKDALTAIRAERPLSHRELHPLEGSI